MKLNHLNIPVSDVASTQAFFETFFGLQCKEKKGDVLSILTDDAGFVFILSHFQKDVTPVYPRDFHVGFIVDTEAEVEEMHRRMQSAGLDVPPMKHAHGSYGFYVSAPGNITVEVCSYENGQ
jgi:catechol 2,3-dioxygenase-like lactoylglutathione lyase family enzyme